MADPITTNNDLGSVILIGGQFRDEILAFPGADTYLEGTILARRLVATAIVATAGVGDTGNGTCTAAAVVAGDVVPFVGDYNLECVETIANGGRWKLEDPGGNLISDALIMTAGAGTATAFTLAGMTFTLTDGSTDFVAGDSFALTVAADGDMVVFSTTGIGGAQIPKAVLTYEETQTGAADVAARVMVDGTVRKERLVIDGSAAGVGITDEIIEQLRDFSIISGDVDELNILDNQ